jgi:hypothetical protein
MREARHTGVSSAERVQPARTQARSLAIAWVALALGALFSGCQPGIGDACTTALQCSSSGSRLCDMTQPHGYCTLVGCDEGTCPSEAVCVKFWPKVAMPQDSDRLGTNYCMYKCTTNSDCRSGYSCLSQTEFGAMDESEVLGHPKQRFCAVRDRPVAADAGPADSGAPDSGVADAAANMSIDDAAMSVEDAGY